MRNKWMALVALLCMVCMIVCIPAGAVFAEDKKDAEYFSGEIKVLRQEEERDTFQVTVGNSGDDFSGIVQVIFASAGGGNCAYNTQIVLPSQSEKQFTLTVPASAVDAMRGLGVINFLEEDGTTVQTISFRNVFGSNVSGIPVGILSDDFSALTYLDMGGEDFYVGNLTYPIDLVELNADNLKGYLDGLYYLVIDRFDASTLGQENIEAIQNWVKAGGWLIVGTGAYGEHTLGGFDPDFLELEVASVSEPGTNNQVVRDASTNGYYYYFHSMGIDFTQMSVAELLDSAQNIFYYDSSEYPGLCAPVGDGAVLVLKISLGEEEMKKADSGLCAMLYNDVMYNSSSSNMNGNSGVTSYWGKQALAIIDHNSTELDFTWLKIVIGVYVVLVGPMLYLILRKCKKSEWYWIGVPVLGLLFIGSVFVFGQGIRVTEARAYSVTTQRGGSNKVRTHYEAYHSGLKEWKLSLGDSYEIGGPDYVGDSYVGSFNGDYTYVVQTDSDGLSVGIKPTENFESAYFFADGSKENPGTITGEQIATDTLTGETTGIVTNESPYDLKYMAVMAGGGIMIIQDVKAKETVDLAQAVKDNRCIYQDASSYYDDVLYTMIDEIRYNYAALPEDVDKADLAALLVGLIDGSSEYLQQEQKVVLAGVVVDYPKTIKGKCKERAYGCLYNVLDVEVENDAAN